MQAKYGAEYAKRIVVTGSKGSGQLYELASLHGYAFLPFPPDIGGRFSVLSPVGLFPLAVAGVDIRALLSGACAMQKVVRTQQAKDNPAGANTHYNKTKRIKCTLLVKSFLQFQIA